MRLELIQAPEEPPVSLAETKLRLRIDATDDDAGIQRLINVATRHVEQICQRALVTQRWALVLDSFPRGNAPIRVPLPPLQSVEAVTYLDREGIAQTLPATDYLVDKGALVGFVHPDFGVAWPATRAQPMAVRVEFTAGYGPAAAVPADIVAAMLLLVGHLDQNREAVVIGSAPAELPLGVAALLSPYTIPGMP